MRRREEILSRIPHMEAMPGIAMEIIRLLREEEFSMEEMIRKLELDPSMTSNILRMANSASFGAACSTSSLREAVNRLGANRIYKMAVAFAVAPVATRAVAGYGLSAGELWLHSIVVAIGVEKIAEEAGINIPEYAFTAAVLHDIGKIVMGTYLEIDDEPIKLLLSRKGYTFDAAEEKVMGINHAEAGAVLLAEWKIPMEIIDVVRWHHDPGRKKGDPEVVELVHLADALSMMCGFGSGIDRLQYKPSEEIMRKYGIKPRKTEKLISEMISSLEEAKEMFGIQVNTGGSHDVTECIDSR